MGYLTEEEIYGLWMKVVKRQTKGKLRLVSQLH